MKLQRSIDKAIGITILASTIILASGAVTGVVLFSPIILPIISTATIGIAIILGIFLYCISKFKIKSREKFTIEPYNSVKDAPNTTETDLRRSPKITINTREITKKLTQLKKIKEKHPDDAFIDIEKEIQLEIKEIINTLKTQLHLSDAQWEVFQDYINQKIQTHISNKISKSPLEGLIPHFVLDEIKISKQSENIQIEYVGKITFTVPPKEEKEEKRTVFEGTITTSITLTPSSDSLEASKPQIEMQLERNYESLDIIENLSKKSTKPIKKKPIQSQSDLLLRNVNALLTDISRDSNISENLNNYNTSIQAIETQLEKIRPSANPSTLAEINTKIAQIQARLSPIQEAEVAKRLESV
ncbi:MAG: hypothetical protein A3F40_00180 [Chlamydiae bacterium RIFCSPHIGHO2_12_FULL_27_8]|nr:MAG: hypothetical protein A3F40_00180 [Chlamydiae bacterium RIFCSPHIGHO2_12_FULL_27_8]